MVLLLRNVYNKIYIIIVTEMVLSIMKCEHMSVFCGVTVRSLWPKSIVISQYKLSYIKIV